MFFVDMVRENAPELALLFEFRVWHSRLPLPRSAWKLNPQSPYQRIWFCGISITSCHLIFQDMLHIFWVKSKFKSVPVISPVCVVMPSAQSEQKWCGSRALQIRYEWWLFIDIGHGETEGNVSPPWLCYPILKRKNITALPRAARGWFKFRQFHY